jgi:hypothetical protein
MTGFPAVETDVPLLQTVQTDGVAYTVFCLMDASSDHTSICYSSSEFSLYGVHRGTTAFIYTQPTTTGVLIHRAHNRFISLPHTTVQNAVIKTETHKFAKVLQNSRRQRGDMKLIPS